LVTGRFLRLPAGVAGISTGFDGGNVVLGSKEGDGRPAGELGRAARQAFQSGPVEADDRLGHGAIASDAEERRDGLHAERARGGPGFGVERRRQARAQPVGESSRRARVVLGDGDDRQTARGPKPLEKRPGQGAGRASVLKTA